MRISALLVAIIAIVGVGCGDADEGDAAGEEEEYETSNADLREPDVVSVQVGSSSAVQREIVTEEDTEAVEVTVVVEGDSIDDWLEVGLHIELVAPLGDRKLIDGTTGEPVEVHSGEHASIDR